MPPTRAGMYDAAVEQFIADTKQLDILSGRSNTLGDTLYVIGIPAQVDTLMIEYLKTSASPKIITSNLARERVPIQLSPLIQGVIIKTLAPAALLSMPFEKTKKMHVLEFQETLFDKKKEEAILGYKYLCGAACGCQTFLILRMSHDGMPPLVLRSTDYLVY